VDADPGHPAAGVTARAEPLARRDAGHRPARTPPPRCATAPDRPPEVADHLLRHQHSGPGWTLPALEVRHRQRARCEDRIRALKDTGLRNLPFHGYDQNRIWVEVVALAADMLA